MSEALLEAGVIPSDEELVQTAIFTALSTGALEGGTAVSAGRNGRQKGFAGGSGRNTRLTERDTEAYLHVGKKQSVRNAKAAAVAAGEKVILDGDIETKDYIQGAISGEVSGIPKAYGMVGKAMADDIYAVSNGVFDVEGWYLELVSSDIKHAYDQHSTAKRVGNVPLTEQDFLSIPEYIDNYDDILECKIYKNGDKEILLGKKINGYSIIVEVVSNNRQSLHFKNMWGMETGAYERQYKSRNTDFHPDR